MPEFGRALIHMNRCHHRCFHYSELSNLNIVMNASFCRGVVTSCLLAVLLLLVYIVLFFLIIEGGKFAFHNRIKNEETLSPRRRLLLRKKIDGINLNETDHGDTHEKMLDFAIVGFPKCSTTFLRNSLLSIDEIFYGNNENEIHLLNTNNVHAFKQLYNNHQETINAFKCPDLLYSLNGLTNLYSHFPRTDLIVSVRHPVHWFESFYNYRTRNGYIMPSANLLIGSCPTFSSTSGDIPLNIDDNEVTVDAHKVCTDRARFHVAISRLGKTPMNTSEELALLNSSRELTHTHNFNFPNKIFLMEIGQLSVDGQNRAYADKFVDDLEIFLNLDTSKSVLPRLKQHQPRHHIDSNLDIETVNERLMDICEAKYDDLRKILIDIGADASQWIVKYLLNSEGVYVSQRQHFEELLGAWSKDPCAIKDDDDYESEDIS